jgi:hypothetical protein
MIEPVKISDMEEPVCITSLPHPLQAPNSFIPASFAHVYWCCVVEDRTPLPVVIRLGFHILPTFTTPAKKMGAKRLQVHKVDKKECKARCGGRTRNLEIGSIAFGEGET